MCRSPLLLSLLVVAAPDRVIPARTVFALIIINKAGGLIYNKTFHDAGLQKISTNDYLVLAGTFHGYVSSAIAGLGKRATRHHCPTAY